MEIWWALMWGVVSASSLVIGALIALWRTPSARIRAILMAFGGGALFFALSIELFGHTLKELSDELHHADDREEALGRFRLVVGVMGCAAILGSLVFVGLDHALDQGGGFLRKRSTAKQYLQSLKDLFNRRALKAMRRMRVLQELDTSQLSLLCAQLEPIKFEAGEVIFEAVDKYSPVYFLVSGEVQISYPVGVQQTPVGFDSLDFPPMKVRPGAMFGHSSVIAPRMPYCISARVAPSSADGARCYKLARSKLDAFLASMADGEAGMEGSEKERGEGEKAAGNGTIIPSEPAGRGLAAQSTIRKLYSNPLSPFASCSAWELCRLLDVLEVDCFDEGDVIAFELDKFSPTYFVTKGVVCVEGERKRAPAAILPEAEGSLPRVCKIVAEEDLTVVLRLSAQDREAVLRGAGSSLRNAFERCGLEKGVGARGAGLQSNISPVLPVVEHEFPTSRHDTNNNQMGQYGVTPECIGVTDTETPVTMAAPRDETHHFTAASSSRPPQLEGDVVGQGGEEEEEKEVEDFQGVEEENEDKSRQQIRTQTQARTEPRGQRPPPQPGGEGRGAIHPRPTPTPIDTIEAAESPQVVPPWNRQRQEREKEKDDSARSTANVVRMSSAGLPLRSSQHGGENDAYLPILRMASYTFLPPSSPPPNAPSSPISPSWLGRGWRHGGGLTRLDSSESGLGERERKRDREREREDHQMAVQRQETAEDVEMAALVSAAAAELRDGGRFRLHIRPGVGGDDDSDEERKELKDEKEGGEKGKGTAEAEEEAHRARTRQVALMIWTGLMLDAMPESLVIGFLVASESATPLVFVVGVFLSNLPEALSSSAMMKSAGMSPIRILALWTFTMVFTGVGAMVGAAIVPEGGITGDFQLFVDSMKGFAAGAMLSMIAQTMLPEAFEMGQGSTGFACLMGFVCALWVGMIEPH
uniref:Zinc transporter ZIP11 n=1 Tax=Chromera velia CCMP2878 TaxID=1169474 RepID=A0A0G4HY01_9ALVE|eukprot:Cvel_33370.t1-p1 / transcript=Cvel_33370.t1 / gene=Cvel_33370 / organism=Chromera_velia_CCMP2878 / gene_product=hypothetical protein / transcript_product=hypothetical protein / location=Cvel_scaffold5399:705-4780(-) / protein_length=925 / sequence_SO=supercontig / SO=protein_coding / is_pseudo=false